jgi:hypothetical protein
LAPQQERLEVAPNPANLPKVKLLDYGEKIVDMLWIWEVFDRVIYFL